MTESTAESPYAGVLGAFPYAFRATGSRLCRAYIVLGSLLAVLVAVVFALGVVTLIGSTIGDPGGLLTSARAFYIVVALFLAGPLLAPILLVARRHRHGKGDAGYDRAMAAAGLVFALSLYLGLVASMPPTFELDGETMVRPAADGLFAPVIEFLYAIPEPAWPVVPGTAAVLMGIVHWQYR